MASHPRAISRERDVNVRTDPTPNTHEQGDTRLIMNLGQYEDEDEDLAYNLAAQVEQDRFTKRQHRHWHVYGADNTRTSEERVVPIVITRSRGSFVAEDDTHSDSEFTDYTTSADTVTTYDSDDYGVAPATGSSFSSRFSFDAPRWELDVTNSESDQGHGLPTWVLASDSDLPGLESYAYGFGIDGLEGEGSVSGLEDEMMEDCAISNVPIQDTSSSAFPSSGSSPHGEHSSGPDSEHQCTGLNTCACSQTDIDQRFSPQCHRTRATSNASRTSSCRDMPKADNWPF